MDWQVLVALVLAIPIILIPVALVWFLNLGGLYRSFQAARQRKQLVRERKIGVVVETKNNN